MLKKSSIGFKSFKKTISHGFSSDGLSIHSYAQGIKNYIIGNPETHSQKLAFAGPKDDDYRYICDVDRGRADFEDLEFYAYKDPLVFVATNFLWPQACLGHGYFVKGENTAAVEECKRIIKLQSFEPALLQSLVHVFIYGVGFSEIVWQNNHIAGFDVPHPRSIDIKWDKHGNILGFDQRILGSLLPDETIKFKPEEIAFYKLWQIGDAVKGIGLVEPLLHTLQIKRNMEESIAEIVHRWANPFWIVKKQGALPSEIKDIEDRFKDINRRSVFGGSEKYDFEIIGADGAIPDLSKSLDFILNEVCAGLRIPKPILLAAGNQVNRATLEWLIKFNETEISMIQSRISKIVEEQIFKRALDKLNINGDIPDLEWNPLSVEDEKAHSEIVAQSVDYLSKAESSGLLSREEARKLLENILKIG